MDLRDLDECFVVRGLESPCQFCGVIGQMSDRHAYLDWSVTVSGDQTVEDYKALARDAAAPVRVCYEAAGGFLHPGQLTEIDVTLLGQHHLFWHPPLVNRELAARRIRGGHARSQDCGDLSLSGEPPLLRSPV